MWRHAHTGTTWGNSFPAVLHMLVCIWVPFMYVTVKVGGRAHESDLCWHWKMGIRPHFHLLLCYHHQRSQRFPTHEVNVKKLWRFFSTVTWEPQNSYWGFPYPVTWCWLLVKVKVLLSSFVNQGLMWHTVHVFILLLRSWLKNEKVLGSIEARSSSVRKMKTREYNALHSNIHSG